MINASPDKPPKVPKSAPRVRLHVVHGPGAGQSVELSRCVTLIGTREGCKLLLKSAEVAPVHCALVNTGEEVYLRDLLSDTGTYLNDLKATEEALEDGDTIRIGDWEMRVEITPYTVDTLSDLPHVSLEPEPTAFGVQVDGSSSLIKLTRATGIVGRREGCDVVLHDRQVSRAHLLLFTYLNRPVFCDLLSHNGVSLDDRRLAFSTLHSGDCLQVGGQHIRLILPGVSRRKSGDGPSGVGGSSAGPADGAALLDPGSGSSAVALQGAGGSAVRVQVDQQDRVNIRAAELGRS